MSLFVLFFILKILQNIINVPIQHRDTVGKDGVHFIIVIENTLDILGAFIVIGYGFKERSYFVFGCFQVGCRSKKFSYGIFIVEER